MASVSPGTLGVLSSACFADILINKWGDKPIKGFYEPVCGSAPGIAGLGIAKQIGGILSAAWLLRYTFGMEEEAQAAEQVVKALLKEGIKTGYLGGKSTTKVVGCEIRA